MKILSPGREGRLCRSVLLLSFATLLSATSAICQSNARHPASPTPSHEPADTAGSTKAANGAAPGQPTAPKPITAAHLAALPQPLPAAITHDIDVNERSKVILAHLNEVIRFYRMSVTPIQKIGEPSDMVYAEQAQALATQVTQLAFQSARDEAALLSRVQIMPGVTQADTAQGEAGRFRNALQSATQHIRDLQGRSEDIDKQLQTAHPRERPALQQQKDEIAGELELAAAELEALSRLSGLSIAQSNSSLQNDIDKLQHAVPEVIDSKVKPVANSLESIGSLRDTGVITQAQVLFQLLSTEHAIDERVVESKKLHEQAVELRTPLVKILHATVEEGQHLQTDMANTQSSGDLVTAPNSNHESVKKKFDQLTDAFKTISGVSVPISQEVLLLEQAQGNLISWRAAVDSARAGIMHALLLRVIIIAAALVLILVLGEVWRRAASRYVQDLRRRRQVLVIRRMVVGFLSGLVVILGFVTQFSSLATFAGFITAGIAVGMQTVLLSVAAYFFIVGRYGVRVGDRITVASVTGDVVEVGLVRFYMMELAGAGAELHPTGRIAVFANSVLFQTGTPLYKQIPGTNYAWHEVTVKLKPGTNYEAALRAIRAAVKEVYDTYCERIEQQHATTEAWMDTTLPAPKIETRLQFAGALQFSVFYPVLLANVAGTDEAVIQKILETMEKDPAAAEAMDGTPLLQAVVKT